MSACFEDLRFRGLVQQVSDPELPKRLDNEALTVYVGFDPTSDSLHVGNLIGLLTLRRLQLAGHRPIALAGGGTGLVGDPGGKSEERPVLTQAQLDVNLAGIRPQLERLLDFSPSAGEARAVVLDNGDWLGTTGLMEFLREVGKHITVNQMVGKESVRSRLEGREHGISFTEFSYMLLQAYDFLHLYDHFGCKLQLGGNDQWGNLTVGIDLIRKKRAAEVYAMTWPLILKSDGTKFGKTESGTVWLDPKRTTPYQFYQFFVRTEDVLVGNYLRHFTFLEHERILELDRSVASHPEHREAQRVLAHEVTALVHGEGEAVRAERAAEALFTEGVSELDEATLFDVFADAPSSQVAPSLLDRGLSLVEAFVQFGLDSSNSAARRTIKGGGAYVNNRRVDDQEYRLSSDDLLSGGLVVLRKGRRQYHLLRFA